jgi:hypothetical protein
MRALSTKEQAFVEAYLTCWNATEAARRVKYKNPNKVGPRKLVEVGIQAAIAARLTELHMGADEVLARIAARGRSTIADVVALPITEPPPEGTKAPYRREQFSLDLVKAQQTGAIHQIKKLKEGKYGVEIEMYDALPANELIGKRHKLFGDDKGGILQYLDLAKLSPAQLQRLANGDDPLAVLLDNQPPTESAG